MPHIEIKFEDVEFDTEVQGYCNNPKLKCPNFGHSHSCPPVAPYLEEEASKYEKFFLVYSRFDLESHIKEVKAKHPRRSEKRIRNMFFMKSYLRDTQEKEILQFLENHNKNYQDKLILWDGTCRVCSNRKDKGCTYDSGKSCRYPDKKRYSMEAVGIHVTNTVKKINLDLEWPPVRYYYRFGLVCFK